MYYYYYHHHHRVLPRLMLSCKYGLAHESITASFVTCYVYQRLVKRKFLRNQFVCSSPSSKFYLSLTWRSGSKYKILIQTFENIYRIYEMLKTVYENQALSCISFELFKRFTEASEDLKDDPRSRKPCITQNPRTVEKVCKIVA